MTAPLIKVHMNPSTKYCIAMHTTLHLHRSTPGLTLWEIESKSRSEFKNLSKNKNRFPFLGNLFLFNRGNPETARKSCLNFTNFTTFNYEKF